MVFELIKIAPIRDIELDYDRIVFKVRAADVLDLDNSSDMWLFFKTLIDGGAKKLLVNMEGLDFIDSSGIGILIKAAKLIRSNRGDISLFNVPERIDMIFKPVELRKFIKMFDTEKEAITYFRMI